MRTYYFLTFLIVFWASLCSSQTIWDTGSLSFTKASGADFTLAANQDQITPNVHITRGNRMGIFNIVSEPGYMDFFSPADTEWAFGTTANFSSLTYDNWEDTHGGNPPGTVGQPMVLHLITEDIYIDITFNSWGSGGAGSQGAFSYTRATMPTASIAAFKEPLRLYPNPASNFIQVDNSFLGKDYAITSVLGKTVLRGTLATSNRINIEGLIAGIYFVRINDQVAKLAKR